MLRPPLDIPTARTMMGLMKSTETPIRIAFPVRDWFGTALVPDGMLDPDQVAELAGELRGMLEVGS